MLNVLFVCIGNSCRSQMAEGFARKYGSDVLHAWSAGVAPASIVQPQTVEVMSEKNIDIQEQFPKSVYGLDLSIFDVIVNMSGAPIPVPAPGEILIWDVADPMAQTKEVYLAVRDRIEGLVMKLILDLRRSTKNRRVAATPALPVGSQPKSARSAVTTKAGASSKRFGFGRVRKRPD